MRAGVETKTSLPIEDEERGLGPGTRLGAFFDARQRKLSVCLVTYNGRVKDSEVLHEGRELTPVA